MNAEAFPEQFRPEAGPLTLHGVFERVARRFPEAVAVTDGERQLTYQELDWRAEQLAQTLHAAGVGRDRLVGLCVERSCDLVVGMLGILKAGGGYVPVDPDYPAERRDYVLSSCDSGLVVASKTTAGLITGQTVVPVDAQSSAEPSAPLAVPDAESALAYVIFTSGSTGQPKGVMIEHRNAVRLFTATHEVFGFTEHDVWTNFHSAAFDFSVWEIWGALLFGGRLVVVPKQTARDPQALHELLRREQVTVLNQTPSAFRNFMHAEQDPDGLALRYVVFGGEKLEPRSLAPWASRHGLDRPTLVNMYGITETTVHVTWKRLTGADLAGEGGSLIGAPISDLELDVVDADGRSLPDGTEGVLYVGGAGLARGYLGHPELTAERFPERDGERWYNSGDLGVRLATGDFAYVGRADRQLKVRGFRIEPGEIESVLKQHPGVRDAAVTAAEFGPGDPRLVAYLVTDGAGEQLAEQLRASVAAALPQHLAPSTYLCIDALPVTVNGKLDQDALRALLDAQLAGAVASAADDSVEAVLREIWSNLLGIAELRDSDEFFDLGGTSFSLIQMLGQVSERYGIVLNVGVLAEGATISALAEAVKSRTGSAN